MFNISLIRVLDIFHHISIQVCSLFYIVDFDECLEWNGQASDCSPRAWCINTYGSYMCSCRYEYHDLSFDTSSRPGRICKRTWFKIKYIFFWTFTWHFTLNSLIFMVYQFVWLSWIASKHEFNEYLSPNLYALMLAGSTNVHIHENINYRL